jgi:hypothetical protein
MKTKILTALMWAGLFTVFWIVGYKSLDPDFGWHLQMGRYILSRGIPATDPFSYTMPSYPFVDHEWLTNVLIAGLYPAVGMAGLAALFAAMATAALMLAVPVATWSLGLVPLLMGTGVFLSRFGVRPQVEDWLFLMITLRLAGSSRWPRRKFIIPVLFWLWANLHGGFVLGPAVLGVILGLKFWEEKRIVRSDVGVWILGTAATLINPYGTRLWWEVLMQMTDTGLRSSIAEWQPFWVRAELGFWMLTALAAALIRVRGGGLKRRQWGVLLALFAASLSSLRYAPLFMLAVIGITVEMLAVQYQIIKRNKLMLSRAKRFYLILVIVAGVVFAEEAGVMVSRAVVGRWVWYPEKAVEFLKTNHFEGQLFSSYGWGGYLIWKLPERKEFIDGRMPSWRWSVAPYLKKLGGMDGVPEAESEWAFKDYIKIADEGNFDYLFGKFNIGMVLWPTGIQEVEQKPLIDWSNSWWWKKLFGEKPRGKFIDKLKGQGWEKVYGDEVAEIYVKS